MKHPGTPILYNTNLPVKDGGGTFRARFGVERVIKVKEKDASGAEVEKEVKHNLLAEGSYSQDSEIKDGYPRVHARRAEEARLGQGSDRGRNGRRSTRSAATTPDAVSWAIDLSGGIQRVAIAHGCIPYGNGKARANRLEPARPGAGPSRADLHARASISSPSIRRDRTSSQFRVPNVGFSVQKAAVDKGVAKDFPIILSSGRLVEYEGGGEETRSNKWLAELQQDMFVEINPADADGARHQRWPVGLGARPGDRSRR